MNRIWKLIAAYLALIPALAATGCNAEDLTAASVQTPPTEEIQAEEKIDSPALPTETEIAEAIEADAPQLEESEDDEQQTPTSTPSAGTPAQQPTYTPPAQTTPSDPTPSTPPNLVHEGELNGIVDYGTYCGTCGSLCDTAHNTCPVCFPYEG
ncbi:MAG: hypothetical protein RRY38_01405 [Oscillospiraceae bacterium]